MAEPFLNDLGTYSTFEKKGQHECAWHPWSLIPWSPHFLTNFIQAWLIVFGKYDFPFDWQKTRSSSETGGSSLYFLILFCASLWSLRTTQVLGDSATRRRELGVLGDLKVDLVILEIASSYFMDNWQPSTSTSLHLKARASLRRIPVNK